MTLADCNCLFFYNIFLPETARIVCLPLTTELRYIFYPLWLILIAGRPATHFAYPTVYTRPLALSIIPKRIVPYLFCSEKHYLYPETCFVLFSYNKQIRKLCWLILPEKEQLSTHEDKSECLSIPKLKHHLDNVFSFW